MVRCDRELHGEWALGASPLKRELQKWLLELGLNDTWKIAGWVEEAWRSKTAAADLLQRRTTLAITTLVMSKFERFNDVPVATRMSHALALDCCILKLPFEIRFLNVIVERRHGERGPRPDYPVMAIADWGANAYLELHGSHYGFLKFLQGLFDALGIEGASPGHHARLAVARAKARARRHRMMRP